MRWMIVLIAFTSIAGAPRAEALGQQEVQAPPRDTGRPGTGSAAIRGRVTAMDDGAPLLRAVVALNGNMERPFVVETDEKGQYEFAGLTEGQYYLVVRRRGYVHRSGGRGVDLRKGETARVDVSMERAGTISGRVVDELGEPMADVRVEALRVMRAGPMSGSRSRETDDEGRFRLFELQPGQYVVRAEPPPSAGTTAVARDVALDYVPVYAPGVPDPGSAQVVVIGTTRDVTGVDIRLTRQRTYRVSGSVLDSRGQPPRGAFINYSRDTGMGGRTGSGVPLKPDGQFTLEGLAAGEYLLQIVTHTEPDGEEEGESEHAQQTLVVQADIDDLTIVTRPTATVTGEVLFEGAPPGFAFPRDLRLVAFASDQGRNSMSAPAMASVREDRRFTLRRLADRNLVRQTSRLPDGWWLQRVTYRGEDVTDVPTEFRSSAPGQVDLVVVFTNRVSKVSGTVTDAGGQPVGRAWVVAFVDPRPPDVGYPSADRMTVTNERGAFTLPGLVAERYAIVAFPADEQNSPGSHYERLLPLTTALSVTPGESKVVDLKVAVLPER